MIGKRQTIELKREKRTEERESEKRGKMEFNIIKKLTELDYRDKKDLKNESDHYSRIK